MQLNVLVDNNTIIDRYFLGEPGVSYYIETGNKKIIFDFGYSDIFKKNAKKMNIDLTKTDTVVLSHGHNDHTGGIKYFLDIMKKNNMGKINLLAHPNVFNKKFADGEDVGSPYAKSDLEKYFSVELTKEPQWITSKMVFLGEIPRITDFENKKAIGVFYHDDCQQPDFVLDDSAMVYKSEHGLVIITGCSHAGICNIIAYAKKICEEDRVVSIIGGMHLLDETHDVLQKTTDFIEKCNVQEIYPCHCTDLNAKITLAKKLPVKELGVSLMLNYK